ncbi:O-antigen translocase [Cloacibacterium rupense]|uniref:O-antigen translocase n=1 Tax=Cloacibacterium rupense TaxID=517423 RepID=A0ABQ2NHL2_9FLAO|nr:oligosaccharide flippase family protein [Cloacibacterium rupense]GGP03519.1 O-antigen translocase [Cloacibacterium rupense]
MIQKDKILKSITVFGGLQFLNLAIGIIRSKLAAVWLGTQGVGFLGLIVTTFNLLVGILNLGLPTSTIKHLSGKSGNTLSKNIRVVEILSIVLGLVGGLICLIFARILSENTFKTTDYTWAFQLLSVSLFLKQISSIYSSIIQSRVNLKHLANANIVANLIGILFTLPLYYYYRIDGIIYNIMVVGLVELIVFYVFFKKLKFENAKISEKDFVNESKEILGDGFFFNLSGNLTLLSSYLLQVFITYYGGMIILGNYFSGYTILNTYVSIIFTAMSVDYFPRVSKNKEDIKAMNEEVNFQIFIGIVLLLPILLFLLIFSEIVIEILFSKDFLETALYVQIAVLGVFFKLFSWSLGFIILAKGSRKMIISNALLFNVLFIVIHILGFYIKGLIGLAVASNVYFLLHLLWNYWLTNKKLNVIVEKKQLKLYFYCSLILLISIVINYVALDSILKKAILSTILVFSSIWSLKQMNLIFKWIK